MPRTWLESSVSSNAAPPRGDYGGFAENRLTRRRCGIQSCGEAGDIGPIAEDRSGAARCCACDALNLH